MTDSVEKRKSVLINTAYFALLVGVFYLFMRFAFWPLFPFIFAFFLAMIFQKPVNFIEKKTPLKKGLTSFLITALTTLALAGLLILLSTRVVTELKGLVDTLMAFFKDIPDFILKAENWLLSFTGKLPNALNAALSPMVTDLADQLLAAFEEGATTKPLKISGLGIDIGTLLTPLSGVISTASKLPSAIVAIVITFIATCFITADYDRIVNFIKRQFPAKKREAISRTKSLTMSTMSKMAKAYLLIICITCTELVIGLGALKVLGIYNGGYIFTIAIITALVDILPILGSGTVLIPWGIGSLFMGKIGLGIGILIIYVIISVLRQFIEPRLVAGQLGLPPIATLIGMYLGLKLFGVLGMFILPFTINILKVLNDDGIIHLWKTAKSESHDSSPSIQLKRLTLKKKHRKEENSNEQNH